MARISSAARGENEQETSLRRREWRLRHLVGLALAAIFLFCAVFWAALGKAPLSGTKVVAGLGFAFVIFANLSLGALASGAVIEFRHPRWSRLRGIDHVFMYVVLVLLVAADAGFGWWLFTSDAGGSARWVFFGFALAAIAGGAMWAWPSLPLLHRGECQRAQIPLGALAAA